MSGNRFGYNDCPTCNPENFSNMPSQNEVERRKLMEDARAKEDASVFD
jgi:hypothetical protein